MSFLHIAPSTPKRQLEKDKSYVFTIHMYYTFFNKQLTSSGSNVKNGLKGKQLPTLKKLIQKILLELWVYNFTFSILSSLNFSATVFYTTLLCTWYLGKILLTIERFLNLHIVPFMPLEIA